MYHTRLKLVAQHFLSLRPNKQNTTSIKYLFTIHDRALTNVLNDKSHIQQIKNTLNNLNNCTYKSSSNALMYHKYLHITQ